MAKGSASVDEIHFNIAATCCFLLCVIGLIVGIVIGANSLNDESSIEWIKTTCDVSGVADTTRDCAGTCKRTYNNAAGSACSVCDGQWVDKTAAVYVKSESFTGSKVADKCGTKGLCRRECVLSYAATLDAKAWKQRRRRMVELHECRSIRLLHAGSLMVRMFASVTATMRRGNFRK
jgi:hypothetical protein